MVGAITRDVKRMWVAKIAGEHKRHADLVLYQLYGPVLTELFLAYRPRFVLSGVMTEDGQNFFVVGERVECIQPLAKTKNISKSKNQKDLAKSLNEQPV